MRHIAARPVLAVALIGVLAGFALAAQPASALIITLSDESSEPSTNPVGDLTADLIFTVSGCNATDCTLTVRVDNRTDDNASGVTYDINEIGFNATWAQMGVPELTFVSATKNDITDVFAGWSFFEQVATDDSNTHLNGFGVFDFALIDGVGPVTEQVNPGDWVDFVFIAPKDITDLDFFAQSAQTTGGNQHLKLAAAKFVEMSPVGFNTCGQNDPPDGACDSAYGGTAIPEPGTFVLASFGLAALALMGRNRRRV